MSYDCFIILLEEMVDNHWFYDGSLFDDVVVVTSNELMVAMIVFWTIWEILWPVHPNNM